MTLSSSEIDEYSHITDLFGHHLGAHPADVPDHVRLRTEIIEVDLPRRSHRSALSRAQPVARGSRPSRLCRLRQRDQPVDLAIGQDFLSIAVLTMIGEVREYFRDRGWEVRVPRTLQENYLALSKARGSLTL